MVGMGEWVEEGMGEWVEEGMEIGDGRWDERMGDRMEGIEVGGE